MKITFESLYSASQEAIKKLKKPLVKNKNKRAFDSAIDDAKDQQIEAEEKISKVYSVIQEGETIDINELLSAIETREKAERTVKILLEQKDMFFAEQEEEN